MELIPRTQPVYLGCVSQDRGKYVKQVCAVGCSGCKSCSTPKVTPSGVVQMKGNLPVIPPDWADFGKAVEKCPVKGFMVRTPGLSGLIHEEEAAEAPA